MEHIKTLTHTHTYSFRKYTLRHQTHTPYTLHNTDARVYSMQEFSIEFNTEQVYEPVKHHILIDVMKKDSRTLPTVLSMSVPERRCLHNVQTISISQFAVISGSFRLIKVHTHTKKNPFFLTTYYNMI